MKVDKRHKLGIIVFTTLTVALMLLSSTAVFINPVLSDEDDECKACSARLLPLSSEVHHLSSAPGYCPSHGGLKEYECIRDVTYELKPGGTMAITVIIYIANPYGCTYGEPCLEYDASPEYINAWIDWNGNQVFESDERVLDAALTGYLGINYYGDMSTSNIVTIPEDAVISTYMRVNLGWDFDPNDPCRESWGWGDVVDKGVFTVKTPKIEEIIVTGIPDAKNPMTNCPTTAVVEKIKLGAIITDAPGFEVYKISWWGDVTPGEGPLSTHNPYEYTAAPGTHGKKWVDCTIFYQMIDTEEIGVDIEAKYFELFFVKRGRDHGAPTQTSDNWYHYWSSSDDKVNTYDRTSATYTYMGGPYGGNQFGEYDGNVANPNYKIWNRASMSCAFNYPIPGYNFTKKGQGCDCIEDTLTHERTHQWVDANWHGQPDTDGDELPDAWEDAHNATGFNKTKRYSFPGFPYGDDEEVYCEMQGFNKTGIHANDWANPGKQSSPSYKRIIVESGTAATLTGVYTDCGRDTNGNGLYDDLSIEVGVNVADAGTYTLFGNLYDSNDNMLWAENHTHLDIGNQSVLLNFNGLEIRQHRVDGPYTLRYLTLFGFNITDEMPNPYHTSAYEHTEFERPATVFTGTYFDYGTDTDGDGLYNYLTIEVEVNTVTPGDYAVEGWLSDGSGNAIIMASSSTYLNAGSQSLSLNFDGLSIYRHRVDGPYHLRYSNLSGSDQIDFIYDAYTTSVYSYTDFQKTDAGFIGSYSDYGKDTDSDGLYNYLTVEVGIDVSTSGNYTLIGWLYDSAETEIIWTSTSIFLNTGSQIMPLDFDGLSIYKHRVDGPYDLEYLALYDENGTLMDGLNYAYPTSFYQYTDFQKPLILLTGNYTDYGTDTDSDGLSDYLTVDVGVMLASEGHCVAAARIVDENGEEIAWASNTTLLSGGEPQIIQLHFDGLSINKHGVDGPYYLKDVYVYHTGDPTLSDYVCDAYTTNVYAYTDFATILATNLLNVKLIFADPTVTGINVSSLDLSEIDETYKPEGLTVKYAYTVNATGAGDFALEFTDIADAIATEVYKIDPTTTPPNQWVELDYTTTADTVTFTISAGDPSVVFATPPTYNLTVSGTSGGNVTTPGEGSFTYEEGTVVDLLAEPEDGYRFDNWTGDVDTITDVDAASTTITMNDDYSITANFEEVPSGGMCFIATAAYGTPMAEEIQILREFRDGYLLTSPVGRALVDLYYRVSPPVAQFITEHRSLKPMVRAGLLPAVAISAVVVNTTPVEKAAIVGLLVLVSVALPVWATRRRDKGPEYT